MRCTAASCVSVRLLGHVIGRVGSVISKLTVYVQYVVYEMSSRMRSFARDFLIKNVMVN